MICHWVILLLLFQSGAFKTEQLKHNRVKSAYDEQGDSIISKLKSHQIESQLNLYIRVFKQDELVELWAQKDQKYILLESFDICSLSGGLGPKREQGDGQIPEGFYQIDRFNPWSSFHLSLGINYPNISDLKLATSEDPGGDIFIHGDCVTIGCVPITDEKIKKFYIYAVEAKNSGQLKIPVTIFPAKLDIKSYQKLVEDYHGSIDKLNLWHDLKLAYDHFEQYKIPPRITFLTNGRHRVN